MGSGGSQGKHVEKGWQEVTKTNPQQWDTFHPRVLSDPSNETCHKVAVFLHIAEVTGKSPATARCLMFFFDTFTGRRDQPECMEQWRWKPDICWKQ